MARIDDQTFFEEFERYFAERFENRLSAIERQLMHQHKHLLTQDEGRKIFEDAAKVFRSDTLRVNSWTRIAVAVVAALAVIGNGISNVLVDHTESKAMARYEIVTDRKLADFESRINQGNRTLIYELRSAVAEHDGHLEALIVKAGNNK